MSNSALTLYEVNQQIILQNSTPLTKEEVVEKISNIKKELTKEKAHYLLLCKERSDYTIFPTAVSDTLFVANMVDTLSPRGAVMEICKSEVNDGWEFWMYDALANDNEKIVMYLFFNCEDFIVKGSL